MENLCQFNLSVKRSFVVVLYDTGKRMENLCQFNLSVKRTFVVV